MHPSPSYRFHQHLGVLDSISGYSFVEKIGLHTARTVIGALPAKRLCVSSALARLAHGNKGTAAPKQYVRPIWFSENDTLYL